jgi:hypothetical protein
VAVSIAINLLKSASLREDRGFREVQPLRYSFGLPQYNRTDVGFCCQALLLSLSRMKLGYSTQNKEAEGFGGCRTVLITAAVPSVYIRYSIWRGYY